MTKIILCCSALLKSWLWNWVLAHDFSDQDLVIKSLGPSVRSKIGGQEEQE